eukprot:14599422-Alexandrium_andersonii.AAC.2
MLRPPQPLFRLFRPGAQRLAVPPRLLQALRQLGDHLILSVSSATTLPCDNPKPHLVTTRCNIEQYTLQAVSLPMEKRASLVFALVHLQ